MCIFSVYYESAYSRKRNICMYSSNLSLKTCHRQLSINISPFHCFLFHCFYSFKKPFHVLLLSYLLSFTLYLLCGLGCFSCFHSSCLYLFISPTLPAYVWSTFCLGFHISGSQSGNGIFNAGVFFPFPLTIKPWRMQCWVLCNP